MSRLLLHFASLASFLTVISASAMAEDIAVKASGIDRALFSETVKPGDDFYRYANEAWLEKTKIPADKSNYGMFTLLNDQTQSQVRALIENAGKESTEAGGPSQKVGDLYQSVLNTQARNEAGIDPIRPLLQLIDQAEPEDLTRVMGELSRYGVNPAFGMYVDNDAKASDQYAVYLTQTGLTLPDRDYYLEDEERYVTLRRELKDYITDLLSAIEVENPGDAAEAVFQVESILAEYHWNKTENRDPNKTYNKKTAAEMQVMMSAFNWREYAKGAGLDSIDSVVVRQPSYFQMLGILSLSADLDAVRNYLRFRVIDTYADSLTEKLEKRHFDFHRTALSGVSEQEPQWKRAVDTTGSVLGELIGQLYVEQHFSPAAKARMNQMVENLKLAFAKRIESRDWMGEGTKQQALEKLSKFTTKIGYPEKWKDYSSLQIESPVLAVNLMAASKFEHQRELDKLGGPIDRSEWHMTPQTINAYYNPVMNEIVFPAAILQPPFFHLNADDAVNYGAIGAVIGHELSHGFDDKGSKYDGDGNLRMWWTEEDRKEFDARTQGLVKQYQAFEPVPGNFVNGEFTLGENIGDLGGLAVAFEAYRLSISDSESGDSEPQGNTESGSGKAPKIDGLTGNQRFFLGWSQVWRRLYRKQELLKRLITDPHSPSEFRVNGIVRNMDAWYEAFGVSEDATLYIKPEDRIRIW